MLPFLFGVHAAMRWCRMNATGDCCVVTFPKRIQWVYRKVAGRGLGRLEIIERGKTACT